MAFAICPVEVVETQARTSPVRGIYLYFYTDSVAFPQLGDQSRDQAWSFLLAEMIRADTGVPVYPRRRGLRGGDYRDR